MSTEAVQDSQEVQGEEAVDFEADVEVPAVADSNLPEGNEATDAPTPAPTGEGGDQDAADQAGKDLLRENEAKDPKDPLNMPPHGTEVFIGGIPKNATETQIREFSEQAGAVHSVKLAKDPVNSEQNRGFGFVRYLTKESADAAKERLNETQLTGTESRVRISSSQAKNRIYVGNLPRPWTKEQVLSELNANVKGLISIDLVMSKENPGHNRGFSFLTFYNHECAAAGKHALTDPAYSMEGRQLTVSYAEPKNTEVQQPAHQIKAIYVGNLAPGATEEKLKSTFSQYGEVAKVVIPAATERRPEQRFGFVHFSEQSSADKAVTDANAGEKPELDGNLLEVKAARPQPAQGDARLLGNVDPYAVGRGIAGRRGRGGRGPPGPGLRGRARGGRNFSPYGRGAYRNYGGAAEGGYDDAYMGYNEGFGPVGFDPYAGSAAFAPAASPGVTMVPMMLPSGQVGYVLQSADGPAEYGDYGPGPDRSHRDFGDYRGARGRGRGAPRYRPY